MKKHLIALIILLIHIMQILNIHNQADLTKNNGLGSSIVMIREATQRDPVFLRVVHRCFELVVYLLNSCYDIQRDVEVRESK